MSGITDNPLSVPRNYLDVDECKSDDSNVDSLMDDTSPSKESGVFESPLDVYFDFAVSASLKPLPLNVVEALRAARRRPQTIPRDATREEFATILGISGFDTKDPVTMMSFLHEDEGIRSYYGDPEDEAYKWFRKNMLRFAEDASFVKGHNFLTLGLQRDYDNLKRFENMALQQKNTEDDFRNALEIEFLSNERSNAHSAFLAKYRETLENTQVPRRLSFERERREVEKRTANIRNSSRDTDENSFGWKYRLQLLRGYRERLQEGLTEPSKSRFHVLNKLQ